MDFSAFGFIFSLEFGVEIGWIGSFPSLYYLSSSLWFKFMLVLFNLFLGLCRLSLRCIPVKCDLAFLFLIVPCGLHLLINTSVFTFRSFFLIMVCRSWRRCCEVVYLNQIKYSAIIHFWILQWSSRSFGVVQLPCARQTEQPAVCILFVKFRISLLILPNKLYLDLQWRNI